MNWVECNLEESPGWAKSSVSQVNEELRFGAHLYWEAVCVYVCMCWWVFNKGTVVAASTLVPERATSPALALMPDNSVSLHMSLALFELLSLHWSLVRVSVHK